MARSDLAATVVSYHDRDFFELRLGEKLARPVECRLITGKGILLKGRSMDRAHSAATVVSYHARHFLELLLGEKLARSVEAACIDRKLEQWPDRTSLRPWSRTTLEISSSFGSGKSSHVPSNDASSLERGFY